MRKITFVLTTLFFLVNISPVFAADVVINEFQIKPSNSQWVELYNKGESPIDISGWIIDDNRNKEKYTIDNGVTLPSKKCISFQSGKFNFNITASDSARLIVNNEVVDSYSYSVSPTPRENSSFGRSVDGGDSWIIFDNPSRDKLNSTGEICLVPTPTPTPTPTNIPTSAPNPSNTPVPSATPQLTSSPTVRSSATPTKKPGVTPRVYDPDAEAVTPRQEPTGAVLGETTNSTNNNAKDKPTNNRQGISLLLLLLLIGGGVGCIAAAVVLSTKEIRRQRQFNL